MKNFVKISLVLTFLSHLSCTHTVYSMNVQELQRSAIASELGAHCADSCTLKNCWQETKDITVCNVTFALRTDFYKKAVLLKTSEGLSSKGLKVGFCGKDSATSQFVSAFFQGMGADLAAGATGGSSVSPSSMAAVGADNGGTVSQATDLKAVVKNACASTPEIAGR